VRVKILSDVPVSLNLHDGSQACCAFSQTAIHPEGRVFCVYRRGSAKHGPDGVMLMQSSTDRGRSWSKPSVIFDRRDRTPPESAVCGGIVVVGEVLLSSFSYVKMLDPEVYVYSDEGWRLPRPIVVSRSEDYGRTWLDPVVIDTRTLSERVGVVCSPFLLPDGDLCVPLEIRTHAGPQGQAAVFSSDQGRTFSEPQVLVADEEATVSHSDPRVARLHDGTYLMHLWTYQYPTHETVEVHESRSADGRAWSQAKPISIEGQICSPLEIAAGLIIAASNHRAMPEGIQLWWSKDGGQSWNDRPIQLWDVRRECMLGEPAPEYASATAGQVWSDVPAFSFGTPVLQRLEDNSILLTYYGTIDDVIHIRACRFEIRV
jgi:hypothetical protein